MGITPTNRCKTDCVYCYAERRKIPLSQELSISEWKKLIEQAIELGIDRIELLGGDIFARSDSIELIEYLIQKDVYFFLSTKCPIDETIAKRLYDAGLGDRFIQISLDAPERETADIITNCKGFYDHAIESINNALKYNLNLRVKVTLTSLNARMAPELIHMLYEMGVRSMMLIDYGRSYYLHDDSLFCKPEDSLWVKEEVEKLRSEMPDAEIIYGAQASEAIKERKESPSVEEKWELWSSHKRCSGGSSLMHITADGFVKLCEQVPERDEFFVGNIREQSIMEIWNSKRLLDFIYPDEKCFEGTQCYGCKSFEDCHRTSGHCFRDALFTNGTRYSPAPQCPMSDYKIRMN